MIDERHGPTTLVGGWLLALRDPVRREKFRLQIGEGPGWTMSEIGVLEAAFELAITEQLNSTGHSPDSDKLTEALRRSFPRIEFAPDKVREILNAAASGTASQVVGVSALQRMYVYSTGFTVSVHQMNRSSDQMASLVLEAERIAIGKGWQPAMVDSGTGGAPGTE